MKKIVQSLRRKKEVEAPQRITNDTVTEHRKRVLAGGRKFKYPLQVKYIETIFIEGSQIHLKRSEVARNSPETSEKKRILSKY